MEDEGFVALALDADHRQIRSIASNAGECLAYGVLDTERARRVMERIMEPDLFSGWGIRTLSANHPAYNPLGYHLGSVWPCFTALTVRGLMRHGFDEPAQTLARALFEATKLFDRDRLPELFGGHARDARPHPGLYPNACSPQAWSSGAVILLIDTLVGLRPAAPLGAALVEPRLPDWLPEVTLRNMALGAGQVDLRVWREGSASYCRILADTSGLRLFGPGLDDAAPDPGVRSFVDAMP
jgi:glycogen debranching enzyme